MGWVVSSCGAWLRCSGFSCVAQTVGTGFSSCMHGALVALLCVWDCLRTGIKPVSLHWQLGSQPTGPLGSPNYWAVYNANHGKVF